MAHRVVLTPKAAAELELEALPRHVQKRIIRWPELLADDPRREGTKKLDGRGELRRVHVGRDYVVLYTIRRKAARVLVARVAHRSEAYRGL